MKVTEIFYENNNLTPYIAKAQFSERLNDLIIDGILELDLNKNNQLISGLDVRDILVIIFRDEDQTQVIKRFVINKRMSLQLEQQEDIFKIKYAYYLIDADIFSLTYNCDSFYNGKSDYLTHTQNILKKNMIDFTVGKQLNQLTNQTEFVVPIKPHIESIDYLNQKDLNFVLGNSIVDGVEYKGWDNILNEKTVDSFNIIKDKYNIVNTSDFDFYMNLENGIYGYRTGNFNRLTGVFDDKIVRSMDEIEVDNKLFFMDDVNRLNFLNNNSFKISVPANKKYKVGKSIDISFTKDSIYDGRCLIFKIDHIIDEFGIWQMVLLLSNITLYYNNKRG